MALLVATPALMLPSAAADSSQIVILIALLAAFLTFVEYSSNFPSIVEFRDAPPFNRLRFLSLLITVVMLSAIQRGHSDPSSVTDAFTAIGTIVGNLMDLPYSPVRLVVLMLPEGVDLKTVDAVRTGAALAYLISAIAMVSFLFIIRVLHWPARHGAFNVWINLPLFDPTAGGDVIHRLQRHGRNNIVMGLLLPFLIPAVVKLANGLIDPITLQNPQSLIWAVSIWAFLPASLVMRGMAMGRVADMIEDKRRRAYADAEAAANEFQTA